MTATFPREQRLAMWRMAIGGMARNGWLPSWQEHGGKCMTRYIIGGPVTGMWHGNGGNPQGAFRCSSCRRVILRGEGRWWE
jgi:hypothetical protein